MKLTRKIQSWYFPFYSPFVIKHDYKDNNMNTVRGGSALKKDMVVQTAASINVRCTSVAIVCQMSAL